MDQRSRKEQARAVRIAAADLAASRVIPQHKNNGDEIRYRRWLRCKKEQIPTYLGNFTKGLPHNPETGLVQNPADYQQFIKAINSANSVDFRLTPLGPAKRPVRQGCLSEQLARCGVADSSLWVSTVAQDIKKLNPNVKKSEAASLRAWESQSAGLLLDLEGPDSQSVTMPAAPEIASDEASAELAEVYAMALLRDTHFSRFRRDPNNSAVDVEQVCEIQTLPLNVEEVASQLRLLDWFSTEDCQPDEASRRRQRTARHLEPQTIFRGVFRGDNKGPYLSQLLLLGSAGINKNDSSSGLNPENGYLKYGAQRIDQRVRVAKPCKDYMTTYAAWFDVQNAADLGGLELYEETIPFRLPTTPRDMATYVHYDALYQAYLNACLLMMDSGVPFDPGLPFSLNDVQDKQQGFASFGGPHILSLVTEVATRALKAVRYQKFNVHRRLRPEAMAARVDRRFCLDADHKAYHGLAVGESIADALGATDILEWVAKHNSFQNQEDDRSSDPDAAKESFLLPMAFPEGSPMHPCYGAGHATVAGACVTVLKAFFDTGHEFKNSDGEAVAFEPNKDGTELVNIFSNSDDALTVEGELNKLAANISIARNWAGVHYFSDYIESMRMGEQVAIGLLEEQRLCYNENFRMSIPLFDGGVVQI